MIILNSRKANFGAKFECHEKIKFTLNNDVNMYCFTFFKFILACYFTFNFVSAVKVPETENKETKSKPMFSFGQDKAKKDTEPTKNGVILKFLSNSFSSEIVQQTELKLKPVGQYSR